MKFDKKILLLLAISFAGTSADDTVDDGTKAPRIECDLPYQAVGNKCLLVEKDVAASWQRMREYCQILQGELVDLKDANLLYDIGLYMKDKEFKVNFWIGASDQEEEGKWIWASDGSEVKKGTPLWGHFLSLQEPAGGIEQNCAILIKKDFYYMHDSTCSDMNGVICQSIAAPKSTSEDDDHEKKKEKKKTTTSECPSPFEMVGDKCFFVSLDNVTQTSGKGLCDDLGSHLAKIDDANLFGDLFHYLTSLETQNRLWLGGANNGTSTWSWPDASSVKMGTPFWNVERENYQEPDREIGYEYCLVIDPENYYFFSDIECSLEAGVVCQYEL